MDSSDEKVRTSLQIPKELFNKLEEKAKKSFLGRSSWIIQAINEKISREDKEITKDLN
jgi:metal-responsive CopG/Arc/MetJ family transcriptional regulator